MFDRINQGQINVNTLGWLQLLLININRINDMAFLCQMKFYTLIMATYKHYFLSPGIQFIQ